MKKIFSKFCLFYISSLLLLFAGCNSQEKSKDEKLDFFATTEFTLNSFISAVKEYGIDSNKLSNAQSTACYSNESIKKLLTSKNYDFMRSEEIYVGTLWNVMYEDIFSNSVTYSLDSFFETVSNKCVCSFSDVSCVYFISNAEDYMANNESIALLCKNDGFGVYSKFESDFKLYNNDLIDLYMKTNTWINNNSNIAYYTSFGGYYPFAFEAPFWDGKDFKYEGNGYSFGNTSTYTKLVNTLKAHLRDPDSYQSNGTIEFYSVSGTPVSSNGHYVGGVYVKVPFRAKNGFGGYGSGIAWLTYNWNSQSFSWYGENTPSIINSYPFEYGYIN